MSSPVRVRIAPSPTGTVHLGLCRTALFNWAYARRHGGQFLLRVEDTDTERNTAESYAAILDGLRWLGIDWDEGPDIGGPKGPYLQSERVEGHRRVADELLASGHAYRDFASPEELDAWRAEQEGRKQRIAYRGKDRDLGPEASAERAAAGEPFAVRARIPDGETRFTDLIRGDVRIPHDEVDDWVLVRRGGGMPTYNFVVVCDDSAMEITHVLRGEEHLINTPKQLLLYAALGLEAPAFGHLPLMLGTDRKKLSKRTGDTSLGDYRDAGYPQGAILNFLALQGWALDGETEVFDMQTLCANFDPASVSKAGAVFDPKKFRWLGGEYLRGESPAELLEHALPFFASSGVADGSAIEARRDFFLRAVELVQERCELYADVPTWVAPLLAADGEVPFDPKAEKGARKRERGPALLSAYADWLEARDAGESAADLGAATKAWVEEQEAKIPELFQPLRLALTGQPGGPDLFDLIALLGRGPSLSRIRSGSQRLAQAAS